MPSDPRQRAGSRAGGVLVLVPAAGSGERMGGVRKPWIELAGRSVLEWALAPFLARDDVVEVVVATGDGSLPAVGGSWDRRVQVVRGGSTRFESVARAFEAARSCVGHAARSGDAHAVRSGHARLVAVHDGARPFASAQVVDACVRTARSGVVAVAGVPAVDTIKRTDDGQGVVETPSRDRLWYAQTPQVFPWGVFERALARCRDRGGSPTDDAEMVEALEGVQVRMVPASRRNLKITTEDDLIVANAFIAKGVA